MAHVQQNPILSFQYTYDNVGNRISKTVTDAQGQQVWSYEYDNLYRLTTETYPDTHDVVYTYDSNGNRLARTENGESINSVYDSADQLLSSGATSCRWDGNGNLTRKTEPNGTTNYQYDNENHLAQITFPDASTESYGYNGDGLRVQKTRGGIETNYTLSGADVLKEDSSQGGPLPTYYILGGSMAGPLALQQPGDQGPVYHFPLTDGQGSVIMLTDEDGNISDGYGYDAFGVGMIPPNPPPNTTYNPYRYTGQQSDSTSSLVYLRNRYYDSSIGRFLTQDPIGFDGGINFYAYCGNNPGNLADPLGTCFLPPELRNSELPFHRSGSRAGMSGHSVNPGPWGPIYAAAPVAKETGWVTIQPYEPPASLPPNPNILVINIQGELNIPELPPGVSIIGGTTSLTIYIDITTGDYVMTTSYGVGIGPGIGGISSIEIGQTAASNIEDASHGNFLTNINIAISGFLANGSGFSGTFTGTYENPTSSAGGGLGRGFGAGVNINLITNRQRGNLRDLYCK